MKHLSQFWNSTPINRRFSFLILILVGIVDFSYAQVTVCRPKEQQYWTGRVDLYQKIDEGIIVGKATFNTHRSWIKFDLESIPDVATITQVDLRFYVDVATEYPSTFSIKISTLSIDPVTSSRSSLRSEIISNSKVTCLTCGESIGYKELTNLTTLNNDVQSRLDQNWIALGFYEENEDSDNCHIHGYSGNAPQLTVYYTVPPPEEGDITVYIRDANGNALEASEMNAVLLFDEFVNEIDRKLNPESNNVTFIDIEFGDYYVDVYCWDMLTTTPDYFAHSSTNTEITVNQTTQKRPLKVIVKHEGGKALYAGATVYLDSHNGETEEWTQRATEITNIKGIVTFQAWPANGDINEKYRIRVENSDNQQVGFLDNVTLQNTQSGDSNTIETTQPSPALITQFVTPIGTYDRGNNAQSTVIIKNTGTETRSFWVGLSFAYETATWADWPQGWYDIKAKKTIILALGETQEIVFSFILPDNLRPGQYYSVCKIWNDFNSDDWLMVEPIYDESLWHTGWDDNELGETSFYLGAYDTPPDDILNQIFWMAKYIALDGLDVENSYYDINDAKKPLLYFAAEVSGSFGVDVGIGGTFLIDLADLMKITPEGKEGWVTVWVDGKAGLGLGVGANVDVDIGITLHNFDFCERALADERKNLTIGLQARVPGFAITLVEYSSDGSIMKPKIEFTGSAGVSLTVSGEMEGLVSREVNIGEIEAAFRDAFSNDRNLKDAIIKLEQNLYGITLDNLLRKTTWDDGSWELADGQWVSNLKLSKTWNNDDKYAHYFYLDVPSNIDTLHIISNGGTPNGDIYVKFNELPLTSPRDSSENSGNEESIVIGNPNEGKWYIMIPAVAPYDGLNIVASTATEDNLPPNLFNSRVEPLAGKESTQFEFFVDYFDVDRDPPRNGDKTLFTWDGTNNNSYQMTLKDGTESNGTYSFKTTLPAGSYRYKYTFVDDFGNLAYTSFEDGPVVSTDENTPPNKPNLLTPEDGSSVTIPFTFTWECEDPDNDELTYTIFANPEGDEWRSLSGLTANYYYADNVDFCAFEWYIVASDGELQNSSDIWQFTIDHPECPTENQAPTIS